MVARNDKGQRTTRTRTTEHAARQGKGHPRREERRERAAKRLTPHNAWPTPPAYEDYDDSNDPV